MILPTMSYSEISRAYRREINTAWNKIDDAALKFGGVVKKTRLYPVSRIYTIQTRDKTKIKLLFTAYKRSQWDSPLLGMYSTFFIKEVCIRFQSMAPKELLIYIRPIFGIVIGNVWLKTKK